jgi:hypothetical protein
MKLIGKTLMFGLMAAATAVACSSAHTTAPGSSQTTEPGASTDGVGQIGGALTLPGGEHISKLTYKLSNAANTYTGSYDVTNTVTPSFVIANVAAGQHYQLTLTAHTDDQSATAATCQYPAPGMANATDITIANRTTTTANINMQCTVDQGLDAGNLLVNGMTNNCPVWNSIVANPVNVTLNMGANVNDSGTPGSSAFFPNSGMPVPAVIQDGQSLVLVAGATAPNPGALTFTWTTSGGTLSSAAGSIDPNSTDAGVTNQTVFTCPATGATTTETITLTLADGAPAANCSTALTTATVQVTCSNPGICGGAPFATSNGGACLLNGNPAGNDPAGFPFVTNGTTDPANPGDFCCSGACGDGTVGPVSTPFSATGTCTSPLVNNGAGCCVSLLPCTTAGQLNCVKCQGNSTGLCSPTEAIFVQHDITKHVATAPGNDPTGSCYACAYSADCINNTQFGDTGKECEDPIQTFGTAAECQSVISCILTSDCSASAVAPCYCGTLGLATTCQGTSGVAVNGACDTQIAAGLGFPLGDGTDNTAKLENTAYAAGRADQIFQCAVVANGCTACQN